MADDDGTSTRRHNAVLSTRPTGVAPPRREGTASANSPMLSLLPNSACTSSYHIYAWRLSTTMTLPHGKLQWALVAPLTARVPHLEGSADKPTRSQQSPRPRKRHTGTHKMMQETLVEGTLNWDHPSPPQTSNQLELQLQTSQMRGHWLPGVHMHDPGATAYTYTNVVSSANQMIRVAVRAHL